MDHAITTETNDGRKINVKYMLGWLYLKLFGWRLTGQPPKLCKFVVIAAPHTSNWDVPLMLAISYVYGIPLSWIGKHTLFKWPLGIIYSWLGGIPIHRETHQKVVDQMVQLFKERDSLFLTLSPEGTRSRTKSWKSGFYYIARGADVRIVVAFVDYKKKIGGIGLTLNPSGDIQADMEILRNFYQGVTGKRPENFGPVAIN